MATEAERAEIARLVAEHQGLAISIVQEYRSRGRDVPIEDLAQAAFLGLTWAASHYQPARGEFARYASYRIRHEIQEEIRRAGTISMPRRAARAGLPWLKVRHLEQPDQVLQADDDDGTLGSDMVREVFRAMATLAPLTRRVLVVRFGLDGSAPQTLTETARRCGLPRTTAAWRICQGIKSIRAHLEAAGWDAESWRAAIA